MEKWMIWEQELDGFREVREELGRRIGRVGELVGIVED